MLTWAKKQREKSKQQIKATKLSRKHEQLDSNLSTLPSSTTWLLIKETLSMKWNETRKKAKRRESEERRNFISYRRCCHHHWHEDIYVMLHCCCLPFVRHCARFSTSNFCSQNCSLRFFFLLLLLPCPRVSCFHSPLSTFALRWAEELLQFENIYGKMSIFLAIFSSCWCALAGCFSFVFVPFYFSPSSVPPSIYFNRKENNNMYQWMGLHVYLTMIQCVWCELERS